MPTRYVCVPHDIEIKPFLGAAPPGAKPERLSFAVFAAAVWLEDERGLQVDGKQSVVQTARWLGLAHALSRAKGGDVLELEEEDWLVLAAIVESPLRGFRVGDVLIKTAALPHSRAVIDAKTAPPAHCAVAKVRGKAPPTAR